MERTVLIATDKIVKNYLPSLSLALSSSFSSALKAAALVLELAPEAGDLAEIMPKMKTLIDKITFTIK